MVVSYSLSPSDAVALTAQLPLEIQFVVLKEVTVGFLNSRIGDSSYYARLSPDNNTHDMLAQFVSMLGYNTSFDTVLSMAIQEIDLDDSIFGSPHFHEFADFVAEKSIQLKSLQLLPLFYFGSPNQYNKPDILCLLEFHCQNVTSFYPFGSLEPITSAKMHKHLYYIKFINCLNWGHTSFAALYHSGSLGQIHLLKKMVIHLEHRGDIRMVSDIVEASWFRLSTKLVLKFWPRESSETRDCLIQLNELIQKHEKVDITLDISLHVVSSPVIDEFAKISLETTSIRSVVVNTRSDFLCPTLELLKKTSNLKKFQLQSNQIGSIVQNNTVVLSIPSLSSLTLGSITSSSEFIFHGLFSLKSLSLRDCVLNAGAFAKIPATLEELHLDCVKTSEADFNHERVNHSGSSLFRFRFRKSL
ncbi:unnamed protein product [Ambrosiozyma monospora]|uniref:Unnamed protein product n=1 Tax=Ambrosiozyma monospora TaxID=43982 RepID=A0ACB5TJ12_AMBMO|nr:unnamed protein product [Ambrosiozyma monospora]